MARISHLTIIALASIRVHVAHSLNIPAPPYRVPIPVKDELTTVTTNITFNQQPVSIDIDVKRATSLLQTALEAEGATYDGDIGVAATRLVGYDGCDDTYADLIYRGWVQSWKIMNQVLSEADNINWNEASAVEYLGPPGINGALHDRIKNLYKQWASIQPGYVPTFFDWRLHVRCDDPAKRCHDPCDKTPNSRGPYAYTINKDPESGLARINFCPLYFRTPNLEDTIKDGKDSGMGLTWKYDVNTYMMNKAHVWAHELMHVDWATNAKAYGPNDHVSDIQMWIQKPRGKKGELMLVKAYGPQPVKALALYGEGRGIWALRNADSLALYASVRYIQSQLDNVYPHLPLAPAPPQSAFNPNNPSSESAGTLSSDGAQRTGWSFYNNGTVGLPPIDTFSSLSQDPQCPGAFSLDTQNMPLDAFVDEDAESDPAYAINFDKFVTELDQAYVDQLDGWYSDLYKAEQCVVPSGCVNMDPKGCAITCT